MKSLVYVGPNTLELRHEPDPVPGNDEVVVRVEAVGICGSDMHAYHGYDERRPPPTVLGHEAAGVIVAGPGKGRRVTVNPLVTCGTCDHCLGGRANLCRQRQIISMPPRPGAFAEMLRVPESNVVDVPDSLPITKAALAEPIAVAYHAAALGIARLARPVAAARCVVLGGGAIGLATALCLRLQGAHVIHIAETNAGRRQTILRSGPFLAYEPGGTDEPAESTVDLVLDAVGADATRKAACRLARPGGVIVHIGLLPGAGGIDIRKLTLQEITLIGSYCYTMVDFRETVAAMVAGRLGALDWFDERPLAEGPAAFREIDEGRAAAAKLMLRP
ncbi:MAG: zinc-dependent alcohol dehydrogenase [Hyphomicrobiaceae bacterium]